MTSVVQYFFKWYFKIFSLINDIAGRHVPVELSNMGNSTPVLLLWLLDATSLHDSVSLLVVLPLSIILLSVIIIVVVVLLKRQRKWTHGNDQVKLRLSLLYIKRIHHGSPSSSFSANYTAK